MARGSSKADINRVDYVARRQADYEDARRSEDIRLGKPNLKGSSRSDVDAKPDPEITARDTIGKPYREDVIGGTPDFKVGGRSSVLSIPGGYNGTDIKIGKNYRGYMGVGEIKQAVVADLKSKEGKEMLAHFGIEKVTFKISRGNSIDATVTMRDPVRFYTRDANGQNRAKDEFLEKNKQQAERAIKNAIDSYGRFESDIYTDYFNNSHYSDATAKYV